MRQGIIKSFVLIIFLAVVAAACNRPETTVSVPTNQATSQPLIPTITAPSQTDQEKAFLPVISNEGETQNGVQVDPHVEILASPTELKVGDTLTVIGRPVELGLPYYNLIVRDEGVQQVEPIVQVTYDNQVKPMGGTSLILEFVSAEGEMYQATFQLKAIAAGQTTVSISATGEVNVGSSSSSMWSGAGSGDVLITVQP